MRVTEGTPIPAAEKTTPALDVEKPLEDPKIPSSPQTETNQQQEDALAKEMEDNASQDTNKTIKKLSREENPEPAQQGTETPTPGTNPDNDDTRSEAVSVESDDSDADSTFSKEDKDNRPEMIDLENDKDIAQPEEKKVTQTTDTGVQQGEPAPQGDEASGTTTDQQGQENPAPATGETPATKTNTEEKPKEKDSAVDLTGAWTPVTPIESKTQQPAPTEPVRQPGPVEVTPTGTGEQKVEPVTAPVEQAAPPVPEEPREKLLQQHDAAMAAQRTEANQVPPPIPEGSRPPATTETPAIQPTEQAAGTQPTPEPQPQPETLITPPQAGTETQIPSRQMLPGESRTVGSIKITAESLPAKQAPVSVEQQAPVEQPALQQQGQGTETSGNQQQQTEAQQAESNNTSPELQQIKAEIDTKFNDIMSILSSQIRDGSSGNNTPEQQQQQQEAFNRQRDQFQQTLDQNSKDPKKSEAERKAYEQIYKGWRNEDNAREDFKVLIKGDSDKFREMAIKNLKLNENDIAENKDLMDNIEADAKAQLVYQRLNAGGLTEQEIRDIADTPGGLEALKAGKQKVLDVNEVIKEMDADGFKNASPEQKAKMILAFLLFWPIIMAQAAIKPISEGYDEIQKRM